MCFLSPHPGWTSSQSRLFNRVVRELTSDRLGRLAISGSDNEPLQLRLLVDKTAKRFRQILATVQWEKKLCSWLHRVILDFIPDSLLVAYLDILQALKLVENDSTVKSRSNGFPGTKFYIYVIGDYMWNFVKVSIGKKTKQIEILDKE